MQIDENYQRQFNVFSESPENIARGIGSMMDGKAIKNESEKYFM